MDFISRDDFFTTRKAILANKLRAIAQEIEDYVPDSENKKNSAFTFEWMQDKIG